MNDVLLWLLVCLAVLNGALLWWLLLRRPGAEQAQAAEQRASERLERLERELRREVGESARVGRQELTQNLATFQQTLVQQGAEGARTQNVQLDAFGQQLGLLQKSLSDTLTLQLQSLSESNARRMSEVRQTL